MITNDVFITYPFSDQAVFYLIDPATGRRWATCTTNSWLRICCFTREGAYVLYVVQPAGAHLVLSLIPVSAGP